MTKHGTAATALFFTAAAIAIGLPAAASACSPPIHIDYDARLAMSVIPDAPGILGPGSTGRIDFTVDRMFSPGSQPIYLTIRTLGDRDPSQTLPPGVAQPIRLTADPASGCPFSEHFVGSPPRQTYVYSIAAPISAQMPQQQCSVRYEVLPAATQPRELKFEMGTFDWTCIFHRDIRPDDNRASLFYGGAPYQPVPLDGRTGWLVLGLAVVGLAIARLRSRSRGKP